MRRITDEHLQEFGFFKEERDFFEMLYRKRLFYRAVIVIQILLELVLLLMLLL